MILAAPLRRTVGAVPAPGTWLAGGATTAPARAGAPSPTAAPPSRTDSPRPDGTRRGGRPVQPPPPGSARPKRPPRPPSRPPSSARQYAPMTPAVGFAQLLVRILGGLLMAFVLNVTVLSHVQHAASQQRLHDTFQTQLAGGEAPVSEGDVQDRLLADGVPVAQLTIPSIGVEEIVVEGTSSGELMLGPGHRRDTALPGQAGVSVVYGRAAAYGGPFSRLQELAPGDSIRVVTGQGRQRFEVIGVRYAGDPTPASPTAGESRLTLVTARGPAFVPTGVIYVDAELVGDAQDRGARQSTYALLPPEDGLLATDTRTLWALVFGLQFLVVALLGAVWARARVGVRATWVVAVPVLCLALVLCTHQISLLLPNLL